MTIAVFKCHIEERFGPTASKKQYKDEFLQFQQGSLTVQQYVMRFNDLIVFTPVLIADEAEKVGRFVSGLRFDFCIHMRYPGHVSFTGVFNMASRIEASKNGLRKVKVVRIDAEASKGQCKDQGGGC